MSSGQQFHLCSTCRRPPDEDGPLDGVGETCDGTCPDPRIELFEFDPVTQELRPATIEIGVAEGQMDLEGRFL